VFSLRNQHVTLSRYHGTWPATAWDLHCYWNTTMPMTGPRSLTEDIFVITVKEMDD